MKALSQGIMKPTSQIVFHDQATLKLGQGQQISKLTFR